MLRLFHLLTGNEPFEFVSPYSPKQCAHRLQKKSEPTRFIRFKNPLKVEVTPLDAESHQFKLYRDSGRNLVVEVVGVLEPHGSRTLVSGNSRFSRMTLALIVLIMGVQAPIFIPTWGIGILGVDAAMLVLFWYFMTAECRKLLGILRDTVGPVSAVEFPSETARKGYVEPTKNRLLGLAGFALMACFILNIGGNLLGSRLSEAEYCSIKAGGPRPVVSSIFPIKPLWSTQIGVASYGSDSPLAVVGSKLLALNCDTLRAFDLRTGQALWATEKTSSFAGGISDLLRIDTARDRIYTRTQMSGLRAVSLSDGRILWTREDRVFDHNRPTVDLLSDGRILAQNSRGVWFVNPDTGEMEPTTRIPNTGDIPKVVNGVVLQGVNCYTCLQASDSATGAVLWKFKAGDGITTNWVIENNLVYVMDDNARLSLIELQTGKITETIQFEPPVQPDNNSSSYNGLSNSSLAVSKNLLIIHFGDTRTLTAYEMALP